MKTNLPLSAPLGALLLFETLSGWAVDANGDGLDDAWATSHGISAFTGSEDPDGDGRPNLVESLNWTKPADAANPDTGWGMVWITDQDNDKLDDHWMVRYMHNGTPLLPYDEEDGDMRKNIEESIVGTNPWVVDAPWQSLSGAPTSSTGPGSFTLSFRGIPGQSYLSLGSAEGYGSTPERVWDFMRGALGLRLWLMSDWLEGRPPLSSDDFRAQFYGRSNYMFLAAP